MPKLKKVKWLVVVTIFVMSNVAVFAAHAKANPTVTAITPNSGLPTGGTAVAITGTGFLAGATVTIGGAPATSVVVVSATTITAATPAGTGTGDVVVTNILELLSGKLKKGFTYSSAPTVKSISPVSGPAAGGTSVTVDGKDFVAGATVTIGGVAATSVTVSAKSITAVTSAHVAGVVNVVVKNPDTQFATLTGKFTYRAAPTVTSISPVSGPVAGGTSVTIEGKDFVVGAKVTIGGAAATSVAVSAKSITAVTSAHVAGVVNVVVTNPDTQFATLTGKFTYRAAPTLTSISPVSGPAGGGTAVTLTGTNLAGISSVTFGGTAGTPVTNVSATSIKVLTPVKIAGVVDVVVTTAGGSGTLTAGFTYRAAPTLTSISPVSGPVGGGTSVTLTGTNLTGTTSVTFGGTAGTAVTNVSATSIKVRTPVKIAGVVDVVVTTAGGSGTLTAGYTFRAEPTVTPITTPTVTTTEPPTVTGISAVSGPVEGGTSVKITGTNLTMTSSVTFGGTASTSVTILSATSIRVVTPAKIAGVVDVVLITPGGSRTLTAGFTYRAAPKVTSISPVSGPLAGGTSMTITGTGFVVGATVKIGGVKAANVVVSSSKSITAVTFTHVAGVVDVVVTNPGKQFATLVGGFTYRALPAKSSSAIIVKHLAGKSTIALSFPVAYAGKCVTIELGFDEDGQVKFQVVGSVILDASGNGVFTFQRLITSEIVIRAKIDLKTVAELMRPGAIPLPRPPRKIVVERLAGISTIELSLQDKYAQKRVSIELGFGVDGQVKFQVVGSVILDPSGKGVLKLQRAIPAEAVVRARIASVIVAERMRMTLC